MKRAMAFLWALAALACLFAGCGAGSPEPDTSAEGGGEQAVFTEPAGETQPEEQLPVYRPYTWRVDTPESHGVDGALLGRMHEELPEEIHAVVTVKDGFVVDEYYRRDCGADTVFRLASCTKSVTGALIGIAIDEGLIAGVDVSIAAYFPQLAGTDKEGITIRHLLEHTSGIAWYEWDGGTSYRTFTQSDHWVDYVLGQEMAAEPGTTFNYSSGGSHLLSAILEQAAGMTAMDYAVEHLFAPMGMTSVVWVSDPQGRTAGGSGIEMTARDAAKFGRLFLDGGRWEGEQLVPQAWVESSTGVQVSRSGRSGSYGYQWWVRPFRGHDVFYAMGHMGQYIFVVPQLELVCVITGLSQDTYAPLEYFSDYVLAACG